MRHFVAYHNRERMGERSKPFQVYTNKPVTHLTGNAVWVIEGVGLAPKEYFLVHVFVVDRIAQSPHPDFTWAAYGAGHSFRQPVRLNDLRWFPEFKRKMGNFGFGLQSIKSDRDITQLLALAAVEAFVLRAR